METGRDDDMRIGELAERIGVNPTTVRYYEHLGALPEPDRSMAGRRRYNDADAELREGLVGYRLFIKHTRTSDG